MSVEALKEAEKHANEYGLQRRGSDAPKPAVEPEPLEPPKAGVRPSPGAAQPTKKAEPVEIDVLATLGMRV